MTTVVERFKDHRGVPKERLACGHVRTDPELFYNSLAFRIKRASEIISSEIPIKARCYKCVRKTQENL